MNPFAAIRNAVCAIGYARVPHNEFLANPLRQGFEVIGTGFLIGPDRVATCAHVIVDLVAELRKKHLPLERLGLQFVLPLPERGWRLVIRPFHVVETDEQKDVSVLTFLTDDLPELQPLEIVPAGYRPEIGEEIGICGYAHGTILLRRGAEIGRFGPIAQRGIVAALSPFDVAEPDIILLDLTAAHAASGSPVFRLADAHVIGMLLKGQEGRTATISIAATMVKHGTGFMVRRSQISTTP